MKHFLIITECGRVFVMCNHSTVDEALTAYNVVHDSPPLTVVEYPYNPTARSVVELDTSELDT